VTIRAALDADAPVLVLLNHLVHDTHVARHPDYFREARPEDVEEWFRSLLRRSDSAAWIAEEGGAPIGYILVRFHERPESPFVFVRRWCEIDQIAVDPAWRRRGVGRALMRAALDATRERGVRHVELPSWAFNDDAHEAFRRWGFSPRLLRFELDGPP
jgi:GNAT superfamily N-acetyltransferase